MIEALVVAAALGLFVAWPRARRLLRGAFPMALAGLLYDAMGLLPKEPRDRIHVCDLRAREVALFGVPLNGQRVTPGDWLQAHSVPALDVLCALPYAAFLVACIACAAWLYVRDYPRMIRLAWCFFALNVAGFVTYRLYPAAPPWYYHAHRCDVDPLARSSAGPNLTRVDAWLGTDYFAAMYRRSTNVFGAMPSLHVAYSFLVVLVGWRVFGRAGRVTSLAFFVAMCFSAVYLDHHWVVDVLAGTAYSVVVVAAAAGLARRVRSRAMSEPS